MTRTLTILTTLLLMSLITACVNRGHGLHNFGVVEKGVLYRGAAPESQRAVASLDDFSINTVVDLRGDGEVDKREAKWCYQAGIMYLRVPMDGLARVPRKAMEQVKAIVGDASYQPVYVHCQWGSDRTSVVCAWIHLKYHPWLTREYLLQEADDYGLLVPAMKHQIEEMKP